MKAVKVRLTEVSGFPWSPTRPTDRMGPHAIAPTEPLSPASSWPSSSEQEELVAFASEQDIGACSLPNKTIRKRDRSASGMGRAIEWPVLVLLAFVLFESAYLIASVARERQRRSERPKQEVIPARPIANPMATSLPGLAMDRTVQFPASQVTAAIDLPKPAPRTTEAQRPDQSGRQPIDVAPVDPPGWASFELPIQIHVFERGRFVGTNDTGRIMLSAGSHDLELVNDSLQYRARQTIYVTSEKVVPVPVDLPTGSVSLNALPWSEVLIDGQPVGATPLGHVRLSIGPHQIVFRHPQLGEQARTAVVRAGVETRLTVDLRK